MKKILKITLYSIIGVILLTVLFSYISYRAYWPKDPEIEVDSSNLYFYHDTYEECREAFVKSIENNIVGFDSVNTGQIYIPSNTDKDLRIDWCYIPAQKTKEKLLILNSGLHGIEGYTGSAVQIMFIEKILKQQLPGNMGVLILHGLNPYGFKYHRKVTENNIDLNRNCVEGDQMFDIKNEGFAELTDLLMPSKPVNIKSLKYQFFYLQAIYKIIRESMPVLRQAALQGQYDFEKGFYYGGKAYEPQIDTLKPLLISMIKEYKMVVNLDLHTGYGERGTMHLFIDKPGNKDVLEGIEKVFEGKKIDWGNSDDFYTINGEYIKWVNSLVPTTLCIPMLFEFGTLNSQTTFGSLKSVQIMVSENQGAHYGYKNGKSKIKTKYLFDEMYIPSSPAWRSKVISDAYNMLSLTIKNFEEFKLTDD